MKKERKKGWESVKSERERSKEEKLERKEERDSERKDACVFFFTACQPLLGYFMPKSV